ncbi:SH3 domain-containing protein [Phaeovulum sp.]|uniref:SH3 domain-containing protein n=1 Tax=Phaeovulum sp. TaxID=2934796 RepID=UPI0035689E33
MQVSGQGFGRAALWGAMMTLVLGCGTALADEVALAANAADTAVTEAPARGPVTNLPLPRFVSLKGSEGNARRGPSLSHRIDWIFRHNGMPLLVTAEYGNWRRVEDSEGAGGWVHYSLLSGVRSVTVKVESLDLRLRADPAAPVMARAEQGAIARLGECLADWCRISVPGMQGWAPKSALWGVSADELRE